MHGFDHESIEKKWRDAWEKGSASSAEDFSDKKKTYLLTEFPYPSGDGLHVGHVRGYTAMDIVARKRRRLGENVLYPIGWDAFGLPTENYALKTGRDPREVTKENTDTFREQMKRLGLSFDWSREVNTTDPNYYTWTQWIFLQFYKHGLAYKATTAINWCPKDKIGLANEEVVDGKCERCGTPVEKREKEQWMLAITKYAERLYDDLDTINYIDRAKTGQRNWIGKSEGAVIQFEVISHKSLENDDDQEHIDVFTTRPDTIFGATYMVLSPEHPWVRLATDDDHDVLNNKKEVRAYMKTAASKEEIERTAEGKEKTGVKLEGVWAVNPATKEKIPIFVADYVLAHYGTGAVMAVPAHDERDWQFAKKYNLPVTYVVAPYFLDETENSKVRPDAKIVTRSHGVALLKHWSEDKYLMLDWKNGWTGFITGGLEHEEDPSEAMIREIQEETGYKNIRYVSTLGGPEIADFYAPHKKLNYHATGYGLYFELIDGAQDQVSEEEYAKHSFEWIDAKGVAAFIKKGEKAGDCRYSELFWGRLQTGNYVWTGDGVLVNSGEFEGTSTEEARKKITEAVGGIWTTKFKLRDWVFSRQRYWGEPIPMIHCEKCGWVPVPEEQLPVELPHVEKYEPSETGESPLATITDWVNTTCPQCDGPAKRETDVMPNWAGSSWYYLRYTDPTNDKTFADPKKLDYWLPVDWYNGGMEHTTLHLLYSRFWHKFLYDIKLVPTSEPYIRRTSHGLILAPGGEKMSKSKGNVINPDDMIARFGADTLRTYEMFMGPFDQAIAWSTDSLVGVRRFLERVIKLKEKIGEGTLSSETETVMHQTIKKIGDDIEALHMNTAVSQLMILGNALESERAISKESYETLLLVLAPFAPFLTEELWQGLGHDTSVHEAPWPAHDPGKLMEASRLVAVQVNGKLRGVVQVVRDTDEATVLGLARSDGNLEKWLNGKDIVKVIYVPNRVLNLVVRDV